VKYDNLILLLLNYYPFINYKFPVRIYNNVDFPAPLAPIKATLESISIPNSISFNKISFSLYPNSPS
jgi:hypothetical protein